MSGGSRSALTLSGLGLALGLGAMLVLAGLAWNRSRPDLRLFGSFAAPGSAEERPRIARRLISYRIEPQRQTVFRFNQPLTIARIKTSPILAGEKLEPGKGWVYSIKIELLDERGRVIGTRLVYSRSQPFEADGRRRGPRRYYRGSPDRIGPTDEVRIQSDRPFAAIRLSTGPLDPGVLAVDVRVGERRPLTAAVAESAFIRLSPDDRTRLAAANAFPPELLTREERIEVAVNQWRPVGPVGIDGRDFRLLVLYEEEEQTGGQDGMLDDEARDPSGEVGL